MYIVKHYEFDTAYVELTLFKSSCILDCWSFVRNHLTCEETRKKAKHYVVTDSIGRFYDPTLEVRYLRKMI